MGSLCPSSLCHALMDASEVLKHTSNHSVLSSRKPKSCHRRSQHRVRGVKNAGERWAAQFCKGHVIKISSNHGSATKYLLFFPLCPGASSCPCPLRFLGIQLRSLRCQTWAALGAGAGAGAADERTAANYQPEEKFGNSSQTHQCKPKLLPNPSIKAQLLLMIDWIIISINSKDFYFPVIFKAKQQTPGFGWAPVPI